MGRYTDSETEDINFTALTAAAASDSRMGEISVADLATDCKAWACSK